MGEGKLGRARGVWEWERERERMREGGSTKKVSLSSKHPPILSLWCRYPNYIIYSDNSISSLASKTSTRYSLNSLFGVLFDITVLSECNYVVCTFSSQVSGWRKPPSIIIAPLSVYFNGCECNSRILWEICGWPIILDGHLLHKIIIILYNNKNGDYNWNYYDTSVIITWSLSQQHVGL